METIPKSPSGLLAAVALLALGGCAALPADRAEDRAFRNLNYAEQFKYDRMQCNARGGRIIVNATGGVDRDGIPRHRERYICA